MHTSLTWALGGGEWPASYSSRFTPTNHRTGAVKGVGLRPLDWWDCGFESRRGHGCLSLVSVVCCKVEVSATG